MSALNMNKFLSFITVLLAINLTLNSAYPTQKTGDFRKESHADQTLPDERLKRAIQSTGYLGKESIANQDIASLPEEVFRELKNTAQSTGDLDKKFHGIDRLQFEIDKIFSRVEQDDNPVLIQERFEKVEPHDTITGDLGKKSTANLDSLPEKVFRELKNTAQSTGDLDKKFPDSERLQLEIDKIFSRIE